VRTALAEDSRTYVNGMLARKQQATVIPANSQRHSELLLSGANVGTMGRRAAAR
jgi:hypothetical protein